MTGRTYGQFEGLARALDLVGERWTLLIVRELLLGPKRYKDLADNLPGIGTNLLAARLKMLRIEGIVAVKSLPPPAGSTVYELTDVGRDLEDALTALGRWGMQFLDEPGSNQVLRPGWGVLAMRTTFQPEAARGVHETYELRIDGDVFHIRVDDGSMQARQGAAAQPDLILETDLDTLLAIASRQLSPVEAVMSGRAAVEGDLEAGLRCVEILGLPRPDPGELALGEMAPGWGVLTMRATFNPDAAAGISERYELHIGEEVFHMVLVQGRLTTGQGPIPEPDLVYRTDTATFVAIGAGQIDPVEAVESGLADMQGEPAAARRCQRIFGLIRPGDAPAGFGRDPA